MAESARILLVKKYQRRGNKYYTVLTHRVHITPHGKKRACSDRPNKEIETANQALVFPQKIMPKNACSVCCSPYTLGLFFILCVSLIWSAASILVQFLYTKQSFDSPFLLTYIGVSLFTILLPTKFAWLQCKKCVQLVHRKFSRQETGEFEIPSSPAPRDLGEYENVPSVQDESDSSLQEDGTSGTTNPNEPPLEPFRDEEEPESTVAATADTEMTTSTVEDETAAGLQEENPEDINQPWTNAQHMKAAMKIAPVWFLANWTYNASLAYTSITSSTVLASTGSLFTFLFAVVCGDERFSCLKLLGVILGVAGSLFTALHDASIDEQNHDNDSESGLDEDEASRGAVPLRLLARKLLVGTYRNGQWWNQGGALFGDALGLTSAVGYGAYAVMVRVQCPRDESLMSMEVLLGYIGLFNMVALSPILVYQLLAGNHKQLTLVVFGFLVIKGLLDNVLSDYLWARSVVLTSATVATVGLGLTIPLAFLSDVFWTGQDSENVVSVSSVAGAFSVLVGFILVNIATENDDANANTNNHEVVSAVSEEPGEIEEPMQTTNISKQDHEDQELHWRKPCDTQ